MFAKLRKKAVGPDIPDTVEQASAGSPGYIKDYAVGALRERRLLMSLRVVSIALFASMVVCLVQTFLLVSLMPLKEVRPFLVQIADAGDVVSSIRPIQDTFEAKDILTEKLVREYVVNRHEILRSDEVMTNRWSGDGYLGVSTAAAEYRRFANATMPTLDQIRSMGGERRVTITSVNPMRIGEVYIVDFTSTSFDLRGNEIASRNYTATLEVEFRPLKNLTREQMLINPTGFTVVNYSLAEKDQ